MKSLTMKSLTEAENFGQAATLSPVEPLMAYLLFGRPVASTIADRARPSATRANVARGYPADRGRRLRAPQAACFLAFPGVFCGREKNSNRRRGTGSGRGFAAVVGTNGVRP